MRELEVEFTCPICGVQWNTIWDAKFNQFFFERGRVKKEVTLN